MPWTNPRLRASFLLISIIVFLVMSPLLENRPGGELVLVFNMYVTLIAATLELKEKPILFWSAMPVAGTSMILLLVSHFSPIKSILITSDAVLAIFFAIVCASLFVYLGRRGQVRERLLVSVSLYFLLALMWFAIYNFTNAVHPGSFAEAGVSIMGRAKYSQILYFSMTTLTTLGYGDIVAVKPAARMLATLEAAAGVLYLAITVSRLVSAQQTGNEV